MKLGKLKNIIKESIKQLINEQPMLNEGTMNATVCTCGGYKTTTTFFNPAGSTGPCMTPNNPFPSSTNTPDQQGNPQYAVGTWNTGGGAGCNSGYSYTTYFANDMPTTGNTEYTWFDQVHDDANGNCIPNPIDCGGGGDLNCTMDDFQYNATPCGQTHLVPAPGGAGSWQNWLNAQWNAYSTGVTQSGGVVGCYQFGAIVTWITGQLNGGVTGGGVPFTQVQIDRKEAKRDWAVCMADHCKCDVDVSWGNDDPCKQLMADPMHSACCTKCNSGSVISPNDPCMPHCKCCKPTQGEDVRGCLNPAQSGATNIGMPCPGSVGIVNIHYEPCCNYDNTGGDDCKQFYAMPQNYQDGCCEKCQGNISPSDPCFVHCKCCNPRISDDPCKDNPTPECYWCHSESGPSCAPVGGNLAYATSNGFSLYQNAADCNAAEPGCRPDDREPKLIECHKCMNGYPVGNMFQGPNCPQGWTPVAQFNPKDCKPGGGEPTDPSNPVDMVNPGMQRMRDLMEYKKPK